MTRAGGTHNNLFPSNPSKSNIYFGGRYICISAIARAQGLSVHNISYILRGKHEPRFSTVRLLATTLGMTLDEFAEALDARIASLDQRMQRAKSKYDARLKKDTAEDLARVQEGKAPIPRLPIRQTK